MDGVDFGKLTGDLLAAEAKEAEIKVCLAIAHHDGSPISERGIAALAHISLSTAQTGLRLAIANGRIRRTEVRSVEEAKRTSLPRWQFNLTDAYLYRNSVQGRITCSTVQDAPKSFIGPIPEFGTGVGSTGVPIPKSDTGSEGASKERAHVGAPAREFGTSSSDSRLRERARAEADEEEPLFEALFAKVARACYGVEDPRSLPLKEQGAARTAAGKCARASIAPDSIDLVIASWTKETLPYPSQIVAEALRAQNAAEVKAEAKRARMHVVAPPPVEELPRRVTKDDFKGPMTPAPPRFGGGAR